MLDEYALVPDIFDPAAYSNAAFIELCLPHLKEPLFNEALVRDLRNGGWSRYCLENAGALHRLGREIIRKLAQKNRLRAFPQQSPLDPGTASDWCEEALAGTAIAPLTGVIAGHVTKQQFNTRIEVASIERLTAAVWWQHRSPSMTLGRKTADYQRALLPLMEQSRSLMFIDPNLDPAAHNYREFGSLFGSPLQRTPSPRIEFHRSFCKGDGPARTFPSRQAWEAAFAPLGLVLRNLGLTAEVFLWEDFHDRYLISDVVGLSIPAGFDITSVANDLTVWSRLGREDKERWQRQFDPGPMAARLKSRFTIGQ